MTTEVKASAMQIDEEALRGIIREETGEGYSHGFRWDWTINLGHVLTMGAMIVSTVGGMLWTYATFDKRLTRLEDQMIRQTDVLDRSIRADEQLRAIRERLDRLERPR